ncbi:MAG: hypothetical protein WCT36_04715 [Candidatus Gracilibacteria bacterium]
MEIGEQKRIKEKKASDAMSGEKGKSENTACQERNGKRCDVKNAMLLPAPTCG